MSTLPRDRENRLPFCLDSHVEKRYRVSGIFSRILKKLFFFCAEKILFSGEKFLPKIVFSSRKEWFFYYYFLCMMCFFFTRFLYRTIFCKLQKPEWSSVTRGMNDEIDKK
uniref:Uncharacterized protein n=1 Tax=Cacopsylla melanoneura TaxID=428564 RepID=A0A8D8PPC9_9HEMI